MAPELQAARKRLLAERERLLQSLDQERLPELDQLTYGSQAASASQVFEQSRALALRGNLQELLRQVNEALARCEAGAYGRWGLGYLIREDLAREAGDPPLRGSLHPLSGGPGVQAVVRDVSRHGKSECRKDDGSDSIGGA
jgi:hypothetical protein